MTNKLYFEKAAIIGVGLIGGSLAMIMKQKGIAGHITGVGRGKENLNTAKRLGLVDECTLEAAEGVKDADLVIAAVPVLKIEAVIKAAAPHLKKGCIVTDVGSVKQAIVDIVEPLMPEGVHFVPGHPIAGKEVSGAACADADLFVGKRCVLTPTENTDKGALAKIRTLWQEAGSEVVIMDAESHDWILAATSHLPHVVAYMLVNTVSEVGGSGRKGMDIFKLSAGGFRDTTRIASSPAEMWSDICGMNKRALSEIMENFQKRLDVMKRLIQSNDITGINKEFARAKSFRDSFNPKPRGHEGPCEHEHKHDHDCDHD
ncbi:MAG: prephenate dehydrogenase/arogenate dehydrogenase family protein [Deltaproteobacteria bacterium]|nr:prephenate dehydrogenase/arogenate dehydrogenase family protein [Deltaproteobacteria bacterium]